MVTESPRADRKFRVAVPGATGAVGRKMLEVLAERRFPATEVLALASPRSAGGASGATATTWRARPRTRDSPLHRLAVVAGPA